MRETGQVKLFKVHIATPAQIRPQRFSDYRFQTITAACRAPVAQFHSMYRSKGRRAFSTFCTDTHPNYEKNILKIFANLLNSLWLNDAPSAYSFCNLDLHPITA